MCSAPNSDAETETAAAIGAPTTATLARFALPTLAAWLVSPLMSLVDTAVVGRDSVTALNLAALGPATMISDSMSYLFSFLSVATTNLVATALSDSAGADSVSGGGNSHELARIFGSAVRLAVLCGLISALLQATFGRAVLARYTAARSAALVSPAYTYVRIRALGAPAALLVRVGTATCLALKDPLSPLLAVAMGGALNLALDVLLVSKLGRGIGGAAWATVASEAVCAVLVLRAVVFKLAPRAQLGSETTHVEQQRLRPMLRFVGGAARARFGLCVEQVSDAVTPFDLQVHLCEWRKFRTRVDRMRLCRRGSVLDRVRALRAVEAARRTRKSPSGRG